MKKILTFIVLSVLSATAWAHPGHGIEGGGFINGVLHPILGWDHVLAMVAVGLWAASFQGKARMAIPATFVLIMLLGFIFGTQGGGIPMMEQGIAASVLIIGLAAAWAQRIPATIAMVVVGAFALFHGVAHGTEWSGSAWQFGAGFMLSTIALHIAGYFGGVALRHNVWVTRMVGTLIGAVGLSLMFV